MATKAIISSCNINTVQESVRLANKRKVKGIEAGKVRKERKENEEKRGNEEGSEEDSQVRYSMTFDRYVHDMCCVVERESSLRSRS